MEVLLILSVLPALILMFYVYKKDTVEKEPIGLLVRLFILGVIAGPLAAFVETLLFTVFEGIFDPGPVLLFFDFFIGVAVVEEGFKYLFLGTVRKNPNFNYVFDGIVYAVAVALGFATLENILYVFEGGIEVALMRAIFSFAQSRSGPGRKRSGCQRRASVRYAARISSRVAVTGTSSI